MPKTEKTILVLGATGLQGGAVAQRLLRRGWKVRAFTRKPMRLEAWRLLASGAEVVRGDMNDPASLAEAMNGVHGVFSVQMNQGFEYAFSLEDEARQGIAVADAAKAAKVEHLVYTSFCGAEQNLTMAPWAAKTRIEAHIRALGLPATILRPASFMENFHGLTPQNLKDGELHTALLPEVGQELVAVDDIAAFAQYAFEDPTFYVGRALNLGGERLTPVAMAAGMARAFGRPVAHILQPMDEVRRNFSADFTAAYDYFNEGGGYQIDIPMLRGLHPGLMDYDTWFQKEGVALFSTMFGAENVPPPLA